MNQEQIEQVEKLRESGMSYGKIAARLGLSVNTVKAHCLRHRIRSGPEKAKEQKAIGLCPQCGARLVQTRGHRQKRFCSKKCRSAWWNAHPEQINRTAFSTVVCQHCGKEFVKYGNRPRKYCSQACYIEHALINRNH